MRGAAFNAAIYLALCLCALMPTYVTAEWANNIGTFLLWVHVIFAFLCAVLMILGGDKSAARIYEMTRNRASLGTARIGAVMLITILAADARFGLAGFWLFVCFLCEFIYWSSERRVLATHQQTETEA